MNTTTHRKNTDTETKIPEHGTQHVTSPRSSRDGLRYGNEKVCEHSRIATSAPPYYPGEAKRATVDSAVSTYRPNYVYSGFFDLLSPYFLPILFIPYFSCSLSNLFLFLNSFYLD